MDKLIAQLKELVIEELFLEDLSPDDLDSGLPLFEEGLGLDSIDALSLAVVLDKEYGIKLEDDDQRVEVFYSIETMARHITENRNQDHGG